MPTPYADSAATYSYDALSRLTGESYPGTSNTWSYDWVGNRLDSGRAYNEVDELNAGSGYAYDMKGALEYDPSAAADPRLHFLSLQLSSTGGGSGEGVVDNRDG